VPATVYHGDANVGNFAVTDSGHVTAFDVGTMRWSFADGTREPIGTGAADVARFAVSLDSDAPGSLHADELAAARIEFGRAYFEASHTTNAQILDATRFYQIDMELGIMRGDMLGGRPVHADRILEALGLGREVTLKTDAELGADLVPTPRPGETVETMQTRVQAAAAEIARRGQLPACFVAGTRIVVPDGELAIEQLAVGDLVTARFEGTSSLVDRPITAIHRGESSWLVRIAVASGAEVVATTNHPFFVVGTGWVIANRLAVGDSLSGLDGTQVVTRVERQPAAEPVATFNLTVADASTFFVFAGDRLGLWVHNGDPNDPKLSEEVFWGLGASGPRQREDDFDGASAWQTKNKEELRRFMGQRAKANNKGNHGAVSAQQLREKGLIAVATESQNELATVAGLQHYSIRPATNPDPLVALTAAEMQHVKKQLDEIVVYVKAKPADVGCG
jgi:hypothetical protein